MMGGLGGMVAQGMAFGAGSAIARTAIGSMMGGSSEGGEAPQQQQGYAPQEAAQQAPPAACEMPQQQFFSCINTNSGNAGACDTYFQALQQCQQEATQQQQWA